MFVEYSLSLAFVRKLSCRLLINYVLGEEDRENFITSDEDVNVIEGYDVKPSKLGFA